jgi:hypothetical protein
LTNENKLYVVGHGKAGFPYIGGDSQLSGTRLSIKDLAKKFKASGLPTDFEDLRVMWCESADAAPSPSRLFFSRAPAPAPAPAQVMADKLSALGFKNIKVAGYHRLGNTFTTSYPAPKYRVPSKDKLSERSRASELRETLDSSVLSVARPTSKSRTPIRVRAIIE